MSVTWRDVLIADMHYLMWSSNDTGEWGVEAAYEEGRDGCLRFECGPVIQYLQYVTVLHIRLLSQNVHIGLLALR
jgi:hypothetical protein